MRIGINARTFSVNEPGGAVQASMKHARYLAARPDTEVVLFGHDSIESRFPDVTINGSYYPVDSQAYGLFWERVALPHLIKKHDIDVLYCPNGNAPMTGISCPVVMCIHDVNALKGFSSGIHQLYRRLAVPRGAAVADKIVTVSEFSKQEIVDALSVPSEKVDVVYNGVDQFFLSDESGDPLDLPDQYLLFVGSMNPRKNIQRVVKAFSKLKSGEGIQHKLVVIGPSKKSIFKSVSVDADEDIVTPGFVTERELKYAYENADVFVYPSLYEGFGLPPLEAMACGTPVVASNTTVFPEVLGQTAKLVDPTSVSEISDAVVELLTNNSLSKTITDTGKERASQYTWKRSGNVLYRTFKDIIIK